MGGEGSGRKADPLKPLMETKFPIVQQGDIAAFMPNYSGLKAGVRKTDVLTAGSILFSDGTKITQDNSNLFWDDTNNRLGIGTSSPTNTLTLNNAGGATHILRINSTNSHALLFINSNLWGGEASLNLGVSGANVWQIYKPANSLDLRFWATADYLTIQRSNGFVGLSTTSPATKLHINNGALTLGNTTAPSTPTSAGALFVSGGALYYIGSSGTLTKVADP